MDDFAKQLMGRSRLASAVLDVSDFVFHDELLERIWSQHRGRCYDNKLLFPDFLTLMRDALVRHGGSAHQLFVKLEQRKAEPVNESNFYRKLSHIPPELSRALLREGTARLSLLLPRDVVSLPECFDEFEVIVGDGKKIKNAAKRLKPTRGFSGKLLGAKALVAMNIRNGLAVAMSDSLDGLTNDVPLVPELMDQLREQFSRPILSVWDRQFDDARTMGRLSQRDGDAYIVRMKQMHTFCVQSSVKSRDELGRSVLDEIGVMGSGKDAITVRRLTLRRTGEDEEDVVLLSNLLDRGKFSAADLLGLYRKRWGIEQIFQKVTETFSLSHLIGSSPRAVLFQFSYCLLLYNMVQAIKAYVADDGKIAANMVSTFYLFTDICRELQAWAYHTDGTWPRNDRDEKQMIAHLRKLLNGSWKSIAYKKASDKSPRKKRPPPKRLVGGHSSVQRVLEGRAKVIVK